MKALGILLVSVLALTACTQHIRPTPKPTANISPIVSFESKYDFATTQDKITTALTQKGMTIFAQIDHQDSANKAGLSMQPATVIIFGTPKVGTPYMVKDPNFALQLPLKVLITQVDGKVQVAMNRTETLVSGSQITADEVKDTLGKAQGLIKSVVE